MLGLFVPAPASAESAYFDGDGAPLFVQDLEKKLDGPVVALDLLFYRDYALAKVQDPEQNERIVELEQRQGKWIGPRQADSKYVPRPVDKHRFALTDFSAAMIPALVREARAKFGSCTILSVSVRRDHNDPQYSLRIAVNLMTDTDDLGSLVADGQGNILSVTKE